MRAYPFTLEEDASGRKLKAIEVREKRYDEAWLQEVLRRQPDILPVAEIDVIFHPMISIGREVSTEAGSIDNLFISYRGYLTLVETKLWRNPEARREVVAQVMDYANALSKWSYERLNQPVREYTAKYEEAESGLVGLVEKQFGPVEGDHDFFIETVEKNLRLGRFLALIVGDRIRESAVEVATYVSRYPGLALNLALMELQCYRLETYEDWPLLLIPRIVKRTQIVDRSIVQVTVVEGRPADIDIRQDSAERIGERRRRVTLTEEAFWELLREELRKENAEQYHDVATTLIDEYRDRPGIEIDPKESSLVVKLDIHDSGQLVSLFSVSTKGRLGVWPGTIANQISNAGFDSTLTDEYREQVREIFGMAKSRKDYYCPIQSVDIERFTLAVDELLRVLESAVPEG